MTGPVVYVHVGAPKTGTTYLQDMLFRNRDRLAAAGVLYAADRFDAHFLAALDLLQLPWAGLGEEASGRWTELADRVRHWDGTAIISAEVLASATAEQADQALQSLAPAEVHVVYSARDLARQVPAEWQEQVKHRKGVSYADFLRDLVSEEPSQESSRWFWAVHDWPGVLRRWGAVLPADRVHLVTVPPPGGPAHQLWERYRELFGIDPASCPERTNRGNPSLGAAETSLVRAINQRVNDVLPSGHYRYLVRELIGHRTLALRTGVQRVTLPPRLHDWATTCTERWRHEVQERGYDVIGDLDELWPAVWEETGTTWRDPDQPDPGAWQDAALDTVTALLVEAARLHDDVGSLRGEVDRLRGEVDRLTAEVGRLGGEVGELRAEATVKDERQALTAERLATAAAVIRERQELPATELVKRTVVELGDRNHGVEKALEVYRRVRRRPR